MQYPVAMRRWLTPSLIVVTAIGCIALIASQLLEVRSTAIPAKMTASTAFVLLAIARGASGTGYGRYLLAGLLFSWFGDLFLLGGAERWFLFGLVSFLLAHVAYIMAFAVRGLDLKWGVRAFIPIAAASFAALVWLGPHLPGDMVVPVRAYTFIISLMVITAFAARGAGASTLIPVGATLFYLSDLSVAAGQFVQPDFPNYVWGLPSYYCGQVLLAFSAGFGIDRDPSVVSQPDTRVT